MIFWNHERNFSFRREDAFLRSRGCVFEEMKRREKVQGGEAARRRVDRSGPHSRSRAYIGPFRRNAERAAICPAMKIKHRIVPISSFSEVLHVPAARYLPGSGRYARTFATSAVYLKILQHGERAASPKTSENLPISFLARYLIYPDVHVCHVKHTDSMCDECTKLRRYTQRKVSPIQRKKCFFATDKEKNVFDLNIIFWN